MKTKFPIKRKVKQTIRTQKPPLNIRDIFFKAIGALLAGIIIIVVFYLISFLFSSHTKTPQELPKDMDWFYNRSAELNHLKTRIDDIDNQTKVFISKHGTDENGYDPNEREKIISLRTARNIMAIEFNTKAAEYNSYAMTMNRSWNKTLPRQMYDIP